MSDDLSRLSDVELFTRALLSGDDADALLREAERRQAARGNPLFELAAVGKRPGLEWEPIAPVMWPPVQGFENVELCIAWRLKPLPGGE